MAEIVVSAVITALCEKLISKSGELMELARSEGVDSQLNKWKKTLPLIQAVLSDATQKHFKNPAVQLWVNDLQDLAYDIEDVLDDLATEGIRRKFNQEARASSTTWNVFKRSKIAHQNIRYGQQMTSKLETITTKLNDLDDQIKKLGLNVSAEMSIIRERQQEENSLVDESEIMGREGDKEELLGKLLANEGSDKNVNLVSIVGMGGIGKTTLAKVLYNEEKVKDHFEVRAWVCVSEELDVFHISKAIFQAVTGRNRDFATLDLLHVALKENISKKRFLLVLDDVWNEDYSKWELLQSPLLAGAPGSRVIVTTRNTKVASVMDSEEVYGLKVLSNEDALSLFARHAVGEINFEKHLTLKFLGESIVEKCGRLPLALKTLGRVLKGNRNGDEWAELCKSEIWDIEYGNEILPALRLSYHHLPPYLKQLFAYCSLIPKEYVFEKNKLVLLWMAEGFLSQSKGNKSMERLGDQYFEELKSRSFFEHSGNDEKRYTMHDLINDLARSVAGEFSYRLDGEADVFDINETFDKLSHCSLVGSRSFRKLKGLQRAKRLQTFLLMPVGRDKDDYWNKVLVEILPELHNLRVLSVMDLTPDCHCYIIGIRSITKVPISIGSLKHLRYLNFSNTEITCLPEEVSDLYNLQSLLVDSCHQLSSLPGSFAKLINLRHLGISNTPRLKKTPLGIGGLTSLQTLHKVMIEEANGFKISDLKGLSDLHGRLSIMGLDKVINPIQAKEANLHQKKGLDVLEMEWSDDGTWNETIQYEVLEELRPHPNLKQLKILFNGGARFPSWVGDSSFDHLTELELRGCRSTQLTLGNLRSLKKLVVKGMSEVKTFELVAPTSSLPGIAFPSLEVVEFDDMQGWTRWSWSTNIGGENGSLGSFPRLREITIKRCPELAQVSIGLIPSLRVLYLDECSGTLLRSMVGLSSSLVKLKMWSVKGLSQLHGEDLMHLGALEDLYIRRCDELRYLWEEESEACKSLVSLQKLTVEYCKKLISSSEKEVNFGLSMKSLKQVTFEGCETLKSYNCPNSVETLDIKVCDSITSLTFSIVQETPRLKSLVIHWCKNLKSISHVHFQSLTSLENLVIKDCPCLDYSFPCGLWPPNLCSLIIGCLSKPMSEWGPQNFPTSLVELELFGENSGVVSFAVAEEGKNTTTPTSSSCFLLPPSLVYLHLWDFKDVESFSEVLQHLHYLKTLYIDYCPKIRDVKTNSGPSKLTITGIPG